MILQGLKGTEPEIKVYNSPTNFCEFSKEPYVLLKKQSFIIKKNLLGRKLYNEEIIKELSDCDGVIAGTEIYTKEVIKNLTKLKVISRLGVGTDNIDLDYAYTKGIKIFTTKTRPSEAVAELVLALILNFLRNVNISNSDLKNGIWKKRSGPLLSKKTVGIIGFGHIGKHLALILKGFNCRVLAYDKIEDKLFNKENDILFADINELLNQSDIISLHLNLNEKTHHFIDHQKISLMKSNCLLVNTSRGEIIDELALHNHLVNGHLMGACLDVFEKEPYEGRLLKLDNVLLTPHIGSYANETRIKMELEATNNLIKGLASE